MTELNAYTKLFNEKAALESFKEKLDGMNIEERKEYFKKMGLKIEVDNK